MDAENLVAAHIAGDENAFPAIVDLYLKPAYNFAYRLLGNADDAADIVQEAFLKAWKGIRRFRQGMNFKTWLFAIVRNCAIDLARKKKLPVFSDVETAPDKSVEDLAVSPEPLPDAILAAAESRQELERALSSLPLIYREVLLLRYDEEMGFEDIARLTGVSADTARSRHRRALAALRKTVAPESLHRK